MSEFLTYSLRTGACIAVFYLFFKLLLSRETFHAFNRALVLAATAVSFVLPLCVITVQRTLPARETPPGRRSQRPTNIHIPRMRISLRLRLILQRMLRPGAHSLPPV